MNTAVGSLTGPEDSESIADTETERTDMEQLLDLDRFPIDGLDGEAGRALIARCRDDLDRDGMFSLDGLMRADALAQCIAGLQPILETAAFTHRRRHNIYFRDDIADLPPDHPALARFETVNHTICADQMPDNLLCRIYEWPPLARFLAAAIGKPALHVMADPLARANVLAYGAGEALNWHFDRSEFTTTLMLRAPEAGGVFQYREGLRTDADPNYDGVARLLGGADEAVRTLSLNPGTLNVFKGRNTAHRITPVEGGTARMVAVFSYYDRPGVVFSDAERIGFYGRAA